MKDGDFRVEGNILTPEGKRVLQAVMAIRRLSEEYNHTIKIHLQADDKTLDDFYKTT